MHTKRLALSKALLLQRVLVLSCAFSLSVAEAKRFRISDQNVTTLLGYDPQTDSITPARNKHMAAVIDIHGFQSAKGKGSTGMHGLRSDKQNTIISFHFRDSTLLTPNWKWKEVSLGQEPDMRVVLYHILLCYEAGYKIIILFAHSRGGAATINTLDLFEHPQDYLAIWEEFGFVSHPTPDTSVLDETEIQNIKRAIERGIIFLVRPLMNLDAATHCAVDGTLSPSLSFLHTPTYWYARYVFSRFTACNPNRTEPIDIFEELVRGSNNFSFRIFLTTNDGVVSNRCDIRLAQLGQAFPSKLEVSHITPEALINIYHHLPASKTSPAHDATSTDQPAVFAHQFILDAINALRTFLMRRT